MKGCVIPKNTWGDLTEREQRLVIRGAVNEERYLRRRARIVNRVITAEVDEFASMAGVRPVEYQNGTIGLYLLEFRVGVYDPDKGLLRPAPDERGKTPGIPHCSTLMDALRVLVDWIKCGVAVGYARAQFE